MLDVITRKERTLLKPEQLKTMYMKRDTRLTQYLPYPQFLLPLDISGTSKLLYAMILKRAALSQKNAWVDEADRVFIVYPIDAMGCDMKKSRTTIKHALTELSDFGLLERATSGFGKPNHLYVKLPEGPFSDQSEGRKQTFNREENRPREGQNPASGMIGKQPPNNYKNNNNINNHSGVIGEQKAFGRYCNVFLSDDEYETLRQDYPGTLERFIEEMSNYLAANGKTYANYEAAIRMWASNDRQETSAKPEPDDYSFEEGESY